MLQHKMAYTFFNKNQLYKNNEAQITLKLRTILEQIKPQNFLSTPKKFFDGYIFTDMPCFLTFKSSPIS